MPSGRTPGYDDLAACDRQRGIGELGAEQRPAAFNENVIHDTALRCSVVGSSADEAASYLSRNASISRFLKSGKAMRSMSWLQSHHASLTRRSAMASENRRLIGRAGLPT